jgi:type 1 fimbria pilin
MKKLVLSITLLLFLLYAIPVSASGIIIGSGGTIKLNGQTISMNCTDLTVEDGGKLDLGQDLLDSCRHFTLETGAAFIDGSGEITLCGTWENNSTFQKSPDSTISFVTGCDVQHYVRGSGDTDGDGVSDMQEAFHDANNDGVPPSAIQMLLLMDNETVATLSFDDGASYDYGTHANGSSTSYTFNVTKAGDSDATSVSVSLSGADANEFSIDTNNCPATVSSNCSVIVSFNPISAAAKSASLDIDYNDGANSQTESISLTGTGAAH